MVEPRARRAGSPGPDRDAKLEGLAAARMRVAGVLTAAIVVLYFGFILLIVDPLGNL